MKMYVVWKQLKQMMGIMNVVCKIRTHVTRNAYVPIYTYVRVYACLSFFYSFIPYKYDVRKNTYNMNVPS